MYNIGDSHAHAPLKAEARGVFFLLHENLKRRQKSLLHEGMIEIVLGRDSIDGEYGDKFVLAVSLTEEYFSCRNRWECERHNRKLEVGTFLPVK